MELPDEGGMTSRQSGSAGKMLSTGRGNSVTICVTTSSLRMVNSILYIFFFFGVEATKARESYWQMFCILSYGIFYISR